MGLKFELADFTGKVLVFETPHTWGDVRQRLSQLGVTPGHTFDSEATVYSLSLGPNAWNRDYLRVAVHTSTNFVWEPLKWCLV